MDTKTILFKIVGTKVMSALQEIFGEGQIYFLNFNQYTLAVMIKILGILFRLGLRNQERGTCPYGHISPLV